MTTLTPVEVIGNLYAAFGRGDLDGLLACVHPDVEWCQVEAGARHPVIDNGRGIGHDAVRAYFAEVGKHMAITQFAPRAILGDGETVVSVIDVEFADPAVGKTVAFTEAHVFTVREGLVVHYFPILDTAATAVAFGA